ncbi:MULTISPECIES: DUF4142 domain-containing protein [Chryseobacterium]|uniref:Membrane protein n=1 Tax=Chryseobacterium camelliae TaxID=1265445 RepID=A0ABU0TIG2_9FLAO|nr:MULTISPECIES: DUF4142 domain-containing protein [Chryseobacterium]MDT3409282.1 putative membrane protein [Pseudacidovorax intermedius]MDQ1096854.1 putative membrane protein [Chryseobacterium camelliae]MDQ1100796.1 putative membrane protein [Chryseobacterium sp. SORGH_AS_1048]MDR6084239.1 putative membrane protein [Chryseobacterium sp. SORGH_AS_0909]MDR6132511.1 putative membrane protein [Chryseobacterium sp. SORGH_AS_1175]
MKNSVLAILAVAAMVACKKNETTAVDTAGDSTAMSTPADSGMTGTGTDSTAMSTNTDAAATGTLSDQDKTFADAAAMGGMMEVMAGQLASTNATNATVKSLAQMMVKDHTKANDELKAWASKAGYSLPTALSADMQKKYDELKMKKGAEFDRAYADMMVTDHQTTIANFKKEASGGSDASLKSFASKTLPTLEHHLMESEKAKNAVK